MMQMSAACRCFTSTFFFLLARIVSGGGEGGKYVIIFQFSFFPETTVDAVLNPIRTCRNVQYRRSRVRGYNAFKFTSVQSNTRTEKKHGQNTHLFYALIFLNTLPRPLAPPQECPRKCDIHRSYHDGVGNRCFRFCHRGSVWSHASGRSMQPRRAAITTNTGLYVYGGVLVALAPSMMWLIPARNLIGFACGLENIYLVRVLTFLFIFVSSHSPLFLLLFLVIFFYNFKF